MTKNLEADQKSDEEMKDKFDCWCKTNNKDKKEAIAAAQEKLSSLNALVEELGPRIDQLGGEIRSANVELNKNKATMDKAYSIRVQQQKAFKEDETSLVTSIDQVAKAKEALSGSASNEMKSTYGGSSFLQMPDEMKLLSSGLQQVVQTQGARLYGKLSRADMLSLDDFIRDPARLLKGNAFLQRGEPSTSSSQIVGILQTMADDFAEDLQKEVDQEKGNKKAYEELASAKSAEIKALEDQIVAKTQEKSESESNLETSKKNIKATNKSLQADIKFQAAVEQRCTGSDAKFEERIQSRSAEMAAVSKTIQVLRSDEARDLLGKSVSFLQKSSQDAKAESAMRKAGAWPPEFGDSGTGKQEDEIASFSQTFPGEWLQFKNHSKHRLFDVQILQTVQRWDKHRLAVTSRQERHRDMCVDEFNKNNLTTEEKQRQTQTILKKAVKFLSNFYGSGVPSERSSLVQIRSHSAKEETAALADPALGSPEGFEDYKKNSGGSGAVSLIETIIEDSQKIEAEAIEGEQDAQSAYEQFVSETSANIKAKNSEIDGKMKEIADAKNDKAEEEANREAQIEELDQLFDSKVNLHKECDFFLANFEVRQTARSEEKEALGQALGSRLNV
ncbi:unnamed protein product [Cladocopium goreaui]|uniref:Uncharacterized protein n=1 Tax=Cladocopium goreaui TaxID=2562237 RepID=A0A9P1C9F8_9DINO|nr:unnamed protein product [Cladocopium goreaui]